MMYPMKLQPAYKDYLWGGNRLKQLYHKKNNLSVTAESWELSCHPDGETNVVNGIYAGQSLSDVLKQNPCFVSDTYTAESKFPILIKFIDAAKDLSIQVHPSDETADLEHGEQGKAEMWYVVQCEPQSYIYYGLNQEVSQERLTRRSRDGSVCKVLNRVPVQEGDVFFIHPGTIHALGKGVVIAEIQQNSNTTFRVFDYCRTDAQGKQRPLHVARAAQVIDYQPVVPDQAGENNLMHTQQYDFGYIFTCAYFKVARIRCRETITLRSEAGSFHALLMIHGTGILQYENHQYRLEAGDSYFVPAGAGIYQINTEEGLELLLSAI